MQTARVALYTLAWITITACNQADPPVGAGECAVDPNDDRFYPLQPGAWWRHSVTNPTSGVLACPDKVVSVEGLSAIPLRPEVTAYRVVRRSSADIAVRWQEVRGDDIVRHVDEWFDLNMQRAKIVYYCPFQVRVSARETDFTDTVMQAAVTATTAADWPACESIEIDPDTCEAAPGSYDEVACRVTTTTIVSDWTRVPADGTVSVPAGDFSNVRTWSIHAPESGDPDMEYSWVRGLGKVTELRSGTAKDELVDCCLPSTGCTRPAPSEAELDCP